MKRQAYEWLMLAAFVGACFLAAGVGSVWSPQRQETSAWYDSLRRPAFTPPGWLFGPVWTVLYFLMALAAWLVWRKAGFGRPVAIFAVQLALNACWTVLFFGLRRPDLAFAEIVILWAAIVATMVTFARVCRPAAWLLAPYLAWVSFAAVLNAAFWRLNA